MKLYFGDMVTTVTTLMIVSLVGFVNTVSFLASVLFVGAGITEHDQHCPCTTATVQYVLTGFFQKLLQQVGVILAAQVLHVGVTVIKFLRRSVKLPQSEIFVQSERRKPD